MEFNPTKNIYEHISEMIENEILSDRLKLEDQAPSTNEFARVYQINPATALKGMNALVDEGILYKKRGVGMFVTENAKKIIITKRRKEFKDTILPSMVEEAGRLKITKYELIEMIKEAEWNDHTR